MSSSSAQGNDDSQASLSPEPSQNQLDVNDVPIETLVEHLLAAKRSLNSVGTVWKAEELVRSARSALEESVILSARTGFLWNGISEELKLLHKIRGGIHTVFNDGQKDFQDVIRTLDAADSRLQKTMDILRSTMVEATFRPAGEKPRTLLDFVDEEAVETMRTNLKETIDQSQEAQGELIASIKSFDADRQEIISAKPSSKNIPESPIPSLLRSLEEHASEMALLLESLVSHFDLCANAVKHTEGGFAAIKRAASDNLLPDGVTISGVMADPDTSASHDLAPMSEDERTEMLTILLSDAPQVLDVVQELNARLISMEESSLLITNHLNDLRAAYASTTTAFNTLESIASRLPSYINASTVYLSRWESFKSLLEEQTLELDNMRVFYEGYFTSYDGLILEVSRRRQVEDKMKHILRKAMEQVQRLADADRKEREGFRRDVGDFLPADLWEGLTSEAPRWAVVLDGVEGEGGGEEGEREVMETPELGKKVVEDANKREMERRRL